MDMDTKNSIFESRKVQLLDRLGEMISFHTMVNPDTGLISSRTILIEAYIFRSEISWNYNVPWERPHFREWGPSWHELDCGRFTMDLSRER